MGQVHDFESSTKKMRQEQVTTDRIKNLSNLLFRAQKTLADIHLIISRYGYEIPGKYDFNNIYNNPEFNKVPDISFLSKMLLIDSKEIKDPYLLRLRQLLFDKTIDSKINELLALLNYYLYDKNANK